VLVCGLSYAPHPQFAPTWRQWWPRKSDTIRALASTCHVRGSLLVDRQSGVELRDTVCTCNGKPYISGMCGRCFRSIWKSDMSPAPPLQLRRANKIAAVRGRGRIPYPLLRSAATCCWFIFPSCLCSKVFCLTVPLGLHYT